MKAHLTTLVFTIALLAFAPAGTAKTACVPDAVDLVCATVDGMFSHIVAGTYCGGSLALHSCVSAGAHGEHRTFLAGSLAGKLDLIIDGAGVGSDVCSASIVGIGCETWANAKFSVLSARTGLPDCFKATATTISWLTATVTDQTTCT